MKETYHAWSMTGTKCSNYSLSYDKHRLVAPSGLARRFGKIPNLAYALEDTYLAAIWQGSLLGTLRWQTEVLGFSVQRGRRHERVRKWRAPSWSWAAMETPMIDCNHWDLESRLQAMGTNVQPLQAASYEQLKSAILIVRAPTLIDARPIIVPAAGCRLSRYSAFADKYVLLCADQAMPDAAYLDLPRKVCILIVGYRKHVHTCLFLLPVEGHECRYERLDIVTLGVHYREPHEIDRLLSTTHLCTMSPWYDP